MDDTVREAIAGMAAADLGERITELAESECTTIVLGVGLHHDVWLEAWFLAYGQGQRVNAPALFDLIVAKVREQPLADSEALYQAALTRTLRASGPATGVPSEDSLATLSAALSAIQLLTNSKLPMA